MTKIPSSDDQAKSKNYNQTFENLVVIHEDSYDRLVGFLAYGRYKLAKHNWMKSYEEDNLTEEQKKERLLGFLRHYELQATLENLRESANQDLAKFAEDYSQRAIAEYLKEDKTYQKLEQLEYKLRAGFWKPFGLGMLSSLAATAILFVFALLISAARPESGVGRIIQYLFSQGELEIDIRRRAE